MTLPLRAWVFLLGTLLAAACATRPPAGPTPPPNEAWLPAEQVDEARLTIEPVAERAVEDRIRTSGKIAFDDLKVAHVFSPVTGRIVRILADLGARLEAGAPLALLESPDVGSALSDLAKAKADLAAAARDARRQEALYAAHAAAERDSEAAEDNARRARAEYDRALEKTRLLQGAGSVDRVTQTYTLRAPIAGEVISRNVNPGTEVQGQYAGGNPVELFMVGAVAPVWVYADLYEMDLARVHVGDPVRVEVVAFPGRIFKGTIDWISETLDPDAHTARVRATLGNPDRALRPGMYATVTILAHPRTALAVPRSALLDWGGERVVFVERGTTPAGLIRFERRPIDVEVVDGMDPLPVTRGLALGERIVTSGAILLSGLF